MSWRGLVVRLHTVPLYARLVGATRARAALLSTRAGATWLRSRNAAANAIPYRIEIAGAGSRRLSNWHGITNAASRSLSSVSRGTAHLQQLEHELAQFEHTISNHVVLEEWEKAEQELTTVMRLIEVSRVDEPTRRAVRWSHAARYAFVLHHLGKADKAAQFYEQALHDVEAVFGANDQQVAFVLYNYSDLLTSTNHLSKAEEYARRALRILRSSPPTLEADKDTVIPGLLANLASILATQGSYQEALEHNSQALEAFAAQLGKTHEYTQGAVRVQLKLMQDLQMPESEWRAFERHWGCNLTQSEESFDTIQAAVAEKLKVMDENDLHRTVESAWHARSTSGSTSGSSMFASGQATDITSVLQHSQHDGQHQHQQQQQQLSPQTKAIGQQMLREMAKRGDKTPRTAAELESFYATLEHVEKLGSQMSAGALQQFISRMGQGKDANEAFQELVNEGIIPPNVEHQPQNVLLASLTDTMRESLISSRSPSDLKTPYTREQLQNLGADVLRDRTAATSSNEEQDRFDEILHQHHEQMAAEGHATPPRPFAELDDLDHDPTTTQQHSPPAPERDQAPLEEQQATQVVQPEQQATGSAAISEQFAAALRKEEQELESLLEEFPELRQSEHDEAESGSNEDLPSEADFDLEQDLREIQRENPDGKLFDFPRLKAFLENAGDSFDMRNLKIEDFVRPEVTPEIQQEFIKRIKQEIAAEPNQENEQPAATTTTTTATASASMSTQERLTSGFNDESNDTERLHEHTADADADADTNTSTMDEEDEEDAEDARLNAELENRAKLFRDPEEEAKRRAEFYRLTGRTPQPEDDELVEVDESLFDDVKLDVDEDDEEYALLSRALEDFPDDDEPDNEPDDETDDEQGDETETMHRRIKQYKEALKNLEAISNEVTAGGKHAGSVKPDAADQAVLQSMRKFMERFPLHGLLSPDGKSVNASAEQAYNMLVADARKYAAANPSAASKPTSKPRTTTKQREHEDSDDDEADAYYRNELDGLDAEEFEGDESELGKVLMSKPGFEIRMSPSPGLGKVRKPKPGSSSSSPTEEVK